MLPQERNKLYKEKKIMKNEDEKGAKINDEDFKNDF